MGNKVGIRTLKPEKDIIEGLLNGLKTINILPIDFSTSDVVSLVLTYIKSNENAYQQADYYLKTGYSPFNIKIGNDPFGKALKDFIREKQVIDDFSNTSMARTFFKNWETNTTFDINADGYSVIEDFRKKYLGKFKVSQIIKACIYAILTDIDYSTDILAFFILSSNILFVSLSYASGKYTAENFKEDFITFSIPKVSTTPFDMKNYEKVYDWLLKFKYATDFQSEMKGHKELFTKILEFSTPAYLVKEANINYNEYTSENVMNSLYNLLFFYIIGQKQIESLSILYSISKSEKENKILSTPMDLGKILAESVFEGKNISFQSEYAHIISRLNYWVDKFRKRLTV